MIAVFLDAEPFPFREETGKVPRIAKLKFVLPAAQSELIVG